MTPGQQPWGHALRWPAGVEDGTDYTLGPISLSQFCIPREASSSFRPPEMVEHCNHQHKYLFYLFKRNTPSIHLASPSINWIITQNRSFIFIILTLFCCVQFSSEESPDIAVTCLISCFMEVPLCLVAFWGQHRRCETACTPPRPGFTVVWAHFRSHRPPWSNGCACCSLIK